MLRPHHSADSDHKSANWGHSDLHGGGIAVETNRLVCVCVSDVNETLAFETETRPRPRPCKAETETFFETFNLRHCAKTMNGEPPSLDVTTSSVTATATAVFIIIKFIRNIRIKT